MVVESDAKRRALILGATAFALVTASPVHAAPDRIAEIEQRHGGRLGVFVRDTGSGRALSHRADERFLLNSTFKGLLAAFALAQVDAGRERLSRQIAYGAVDLLPASPVTTAHVSQGRLSIDELCAAILRVSDNAAANILMKHLGGPEALTTFVRASGDKATRIDRYETMAGERSGLLDTTTPRAIAMTVQNLLLGQILTPPSRDRLERWMRQNQVGARRLRASFPPDWLTADRTGTGDGECNDYALARPRGRAPLVMAVYYEAAGMDMTSQEAVLREVGKAIVAWLA